MSLRLNKSLTLLELLIAISLFFVIVLAFTSIQYFIRFHLVTSERQSLLQNEASLALEHMAKYVCVATGYRGNPGFVWGVTPYGESIITIRVDAGTPASYTDDILVGYARDSRAGHAGEVFFCPNTNFNHRAGQDGGPTRHEILTRHVPAGGFVVNIINDPNTGAPIGLGITVTVRWDINALFSSDNPEVTLSTTIYSLSSSTG